MILLGIAIGVLATMLTYIFVDRYISMCKDEQRWVKYLEETENEQKDDHPDIK